VSIGIRTPTCWKGTKNLLVVFLLAKGLTSEVKGTWITVQNTPYRRFFDGKCAANENSQRHYTTQGAVEMGQRLSQKKGDFQVVLSFGSFTPHISGVTCTAQKHKRETLERVAADSTQQSAELYRHGIPGIRKGHRFEQGNNHRGDPAQGEPGLSLQHH